ncbi:Acetyl-CoA carboxylase 2 [Camellia lanceoleosa]|uniref:Acetyl-CoA carboxylase 2 n=1 Tax=Camellia lanceoleosa TaxID=1840588 RepID=A0ACC0FIR4_9ERIC|nr:Acetyl-CoA carboxylase 2 [Camellia lanceoleosa]
MEHGREYDAWRRTSIFATPFNFDKAESTRPKGHCVAVHVTSEDPDDGFKPTSGKVQVELGFENGLVDDIFFVPGYDIRGFVVAQAAPIFDML